MRIFLGNYLSLLAVLFLIISSEHLAVKGGIYNKQNPVTIQHDLYKFIETTKGTSKLQSPANLQQDFHRFIRKTGGASDLQSSYSTLSSRPQSSFVPPIKPKGEFNEKRSTYKRVKRSSYQEQINFKPSAPSYVGRKFDQYRYRSLTNSDVGRLERLPKNGQPKIRSNSDVGRLERLPKNGQPKIRSNSDVGRLERLPKNGQPKIRSNSDVGRFERPPKNGQSKIRSNSDVGRLERPPKNGHPKIRSNSDVGRLEQLPKNGQPKIRSNSDVGRLERLPKNGQPKIRSNSDVGRLERLPKNGQPKIRSRPRGLMDFGLMELGGFSKHRPQILFKPQKHSQNSSIPQYLQNPFLNQPINPQRNPRFLSIDNRFITHNQQHTKLHNSDTFPPRKTSTKPQSSVHNLSHQFSRFDTRPKKTQGHTNTHFKIHRPQTDQIKSFSRPSSRPVDFSSILNKPVTSAVNVPDNNEDRTKDMHNRPKKTKGHTNSHFTIHRPQTDQNLAFSRPRNRPVDFSSILNKPVSSAVKVPGTNDDGTENRPHRKFTKPEESSDFGKPGCSTPSGLRRPGEVWYSNGCRRSQCIGFRGRSFIATDQCDTEIYNTKYKCIIDVDIKARFPGCCPRYSCNPDNLGNLVEKST